jgi:protein-S-isoprenylcysteine O-methyltransferase Ste14
MSETDQSEESGPARPPRSLPRGAALAVWIVMWFVLLPLVHAGIPWALSTLAPRYGWTDGRPSAWNLSGLVLAAAGLACVAWLMVLHFTAARGQVRLERTPTYLLQRGPYRFSRNPMYLAELALWLGWALFYGSAAVLIGAAVLWLLFNFRAIPREERDLEARFGEDYRRYLATVPRWLGRPRG